MNEYRVFFGNDEIYTVYADKVYTTPMETTRFILNDEVIAEFMNKAIAGWLKVRHVVNGNN